MASFSNRFNKEGFGSFFTKAKARTLSWMQGREYEEVLSELESRNAQQNYQNFQGGYSQNAKAQPAPQAEPVEETIHVRTMNDMGDMLHSRPQRQRPIQHTEEYAEQQPQQLQHTYRSFENQNANIAQNTNIKTPVYAVNVYDIRSCIELMNPIREQSCVIITINQTINKSDVRRFIDLINGACLALNVNLSRLSKEDNFFIIWPHSVNLRLDSKTQDAQLDLYGNSFEAQPAYYDAGFNNTNFNYQAHNAFETEAPQAAAAFPMYNNQAYTQSNFIN